MTTTGSQRLGSFVSISGSVTVYTWQTNKMAHGFREVQKFRTSAKEGGGVWFLADTRGKSQGGWWARPKGGARGRDRAWRQQHPLLHTSSFPQYLVCLQAGVSDRFIPCIPAQCQAGGSQAGLWGLSANQWATWARITTSWDFHVVTTSPLSHQWLTPSFSTSSLLSHTPAPPLSHPFWASLHHSEGQQ